MTTGFVYDLPRSVRPSTPLSEENITQVQVVFERSPTTSTLQASRESGLSLYIIHIVLNTDLSFHV